jgi:hypothetical protein
MGLANL